MNKPFLREVAEHILHNHKMEEIVLVFPNRRSVFFFRKHLSEIIDRPVLMPQNITISELFSRITGNVVAGNIPLLFRLYDAYRQVFGKEAEAIDEFVSWGEILLRDFDDTDKYLVDAGQLFRNITDLKEIEQLFPLEEDQQKGLRTFWFTLNKARTSEEKEKFLAFWNKLYSLYQQFRDNLSREGIAYEGMNSRTAVNLLSGKDISALLPGHFCIIGFNALTTCEQKLFRMLKNAGMATFYWDYDPWYIENTWHEAGFFLRKNLQELPLPPDFKAGSEFGKSGPIVKITAISSATGLAATAGQCASNMLSQSNDTLSTAVVLADENLLIPLIQTLPATCPGYNISIGFPVRESPVYAFIFQWLEMQKNRKDCKGKPCYYYRNVLSLLHHPLLNSVKNETDSILRQITTMNIIRVPSEMLCINELLTTVFTPVTDATTIPSRLRSILVTFYRESETHSTEIPSLALEGETILTIYTALQHLEDVVPETFSNILPETEIYLLRNLLQNLHVPLSGEPLQGLQILGLLETRNLDFENVVVLPANEGILPRISQPNSFIPQNLRYAFGMPTVEHQDAVTAYYFYRLLQRARKVEIFWNSASSGAEAGRMSRFIYQLLYEQPCKVSIQQPQITVRYTPPKPIIVYKTNDIIQRLWQFSSHNGSRLSPSALADYIKCPLLFFFRHLSHVKPEEELTEEPDAGIFGTLFHETMYCLYKDLLNKTVSEEVLRSIGNAEIQKAIDYAMRKHVYKHIPENQPIEPEGQFIIISKVLKEYAAKVLEYDRKSCPFTVTGLEKKLDFFFQLPATNLIPGLLLGGNTDRIIKHNGKSVIADYKTGGKKENFSGISMLFASDHGKDLKYAFQILFYCYIYFENYLQESLDGIKPEVYFLQEMFSNDSQPAIVIEEERAKNNKRIIDDFRQYKEEFECLLTKLLVEITNPSLPFTQTNQYKFCEYCDFREVCRRN